jgi:hypothetical protein
VILKLFFTENGGDSQNVGVLWGFIADYQWFEILRNMRMIGRLGYKA